MRRLVLLGAGHVHVHVLQALARSRRADVNVTLVAPQPHLLYSGMVPGYVAGHYTLDECRVDLRPLIDASGVRYVPGLCSGMNAALHSVRVALPDGEAVALPYDVLSVDTGGVADREALEAAMPGARDNAMFVRPMDGFAQLWPQLVALSQTRALSIALIGAGAAGVELAMAVRHRLPHCTVTLVTGGPAPLSGYPLKVQQRAMRALKERRVTVLSLACTGISPGQVLLEGGTSLACDAPIIATGTQAPAWLRGSGLALDAAGFISTNPFLQSTSHANVYAAGDVATRVDVQHPRSGVYAVRAGPALDYNLRAALAEAPPRAWQPPRAALSLLACGNRSAIASWGAWSAQGAWVWRWKDWIDRRFVRGLSIGQ
ncbi:MAG: FAD-dependent oxidoreductase [Bdellovibrionales bacterium]|nr:FAD-dependent oxidoreductase [Ramlibacter sp.]